MRRRMSGVGMLAAMVFCVAVAASAQVDRATVTGIVKDPSDAVIAKAQVKVTSLATNAVATAVTGNTGSYLVVNLAPGEYLIQVEAAGFQRFEQTVSLELGARSRLDVSLAVGSIGETVTVTGVTALLSTESAVLGTVVDQNEMAKLPLAIRNWDDLLSLVPGVQSDRYTEQAGGTSAGRTGGVSVHGNRSLQNNFLLDGVANNSFSTNVQELTTQLSRPSVDAINEFKVVTSPYAAEYGWSPGAAIIVSTKSGSNAFHGTGYDFFRNDSLDSNNFFAKRAGQAKPSNKQNQFGGNLGGPIVRNRAFFFADVEATRIKQGVLRTGRVLTADERRGVFSSGIRDPLTGQAFPNNTIPTDRLDPVAARIAALLPLPNAAGGNNLLRQPDVEDESERYLLRVDLPLANNNNVFARYIYSDRFRYVPGFFGGIVDGTSTSAWGRNYLDSNAVVAGWTKVFGGSLINEARFSYGRGTNDGTQDPFGEDGDAQIGFRGGTTDPTVAGGIVGMDVSGHLRLGSPNFMPKFQHTDQMQFLNTLTWLRGAHQVKFGADVMAPMNNEYFDVAPTRGNLTFNGQFTGNGLADFMLGYVQRAQLTNVFVVEQQLKSYGVYVQDDWKVSDAFTVNLGVRYDYMTPATEKEQPHGQLRPGIRHAGLRQGGVAGGSGAGRARQEQLLATHRRDLQPEQPHDHPRRLRHLLQPVRPDRIGGPARPQSARTGQHRRAGRGRQRRAHPASAGRLPGQLPRPGEHQLHAHHGPRVGSRQRAHHGAAVWRWHRAAIRRELRRVGGLRGVVDRPPRRAAQLQSAHARHARRQWPGALPGVRQHPVARDDRHRQLQGDGPVAREAFEATATATGCRIRWAKPATRRPSI